MRIKISRAKTKHAEAIYGIECESFSDPWSMDSVLFEIEHKHSVCLVAVCRPFGVIGYASMRHVINEGHISNIAVSEAYKKQGIGSLLVEGLIKEAHRKKMIGLTLEVRASNNPAISLYEKYGFEPEGTRPNYYSNPNEDAVIMWLYI